MNSNYHQFDNEGNANILTPPAYVDALLDFDPYASTRATVSKRASTHRGTQL